MMHDQSKVFANEFYHGEGRYGVYFNFQKFEKN